MILDLPPVGPVVVDKPHDDERGARLDRHSTIAPNLSDNTPDRDPQRRERDPGRVSTECHASHDTQWNVCKRGLAVAAVALVSLPFVLVEGAHTSGGGSAPFPSPTSL